MEQTDSTYQRGEKPPVYPSQQDCVVQQPTVPPSHQQVQFTSPIISQKRPAYKATVSACNFVSCLVTCFCYPFVWAKIAGRVNLCCGRSARGIWMVIMCLIVYGGHYFLPICNFAISLLTAPSDLDNRNVRNAQFEMYNLVNYTEDPSMNTESFQRAESIIRKYKESSKYKESTKNQEGSFMFLGVLALLVSSFWFLCCFIPCNLPIPILTCLLSGRVRQEKQIERNECNDCCSAFCCNVCLVHQMAVETMDETPNCSNIWVA